MEKPKDAALGRAWKKALDIQTLNHPICTMRGSVRYVTTPFDGAEEKIRRIDEAKPTSNARL
jgi:hypothetical protein